MPERTYGSPTGTEQPKSQGRQQAKPASSQQVSEYMKHMLAADRQFHSRQARPLPGRSPGLSETLARGKPPVGIGGRKRERAIMSEVEKAGG